MLKSLVGKGHVLFSTSKQQDASEYWQHLIESLDKCPPFPGAAPISQLFEYEKELRLECGTSHRVQYSTGTDRRLVLRPAMCMDAATNKDAVSTFAAANAAWEAQAKVDRSAAGKRPVPVWPRVPADVCLKNALAQDTMDGWNSPCTGTKTTALQSERIRRYPRYLMVPVQRDYMGADWTPQKHAVEVDMPLDLDLECFRAKGRQPGEQPFGTPVTPAAPAAAPEVTPDADIVQMAVAMGFSANAGRRAALATQNAGADHAVNWIMANMDLPGLNDDPTQSTQCNDTAIPAPAPAHASAAADAAGPGVGSSQYSLVGMVTHQGKNSTHGHYICHTLRKESTGSKLQWVLFNDRKALKPVTLPKGVAFMYLYKQKGMEK